MRIVVTTPAGNVGSRVVQLLLQAGVRPTLLLRHPERLDPDARDRCELVVADQRDAEAVLRATRGADALYWVDPPTGEDDPVAASARLGAVVARAVTENRVPRTVFQSSVGAEKRSGAGMIDGLASVETQLDATGASVLHLRCGYFATNLLGDLESLRQGTLTTTMPLDLPMPWVAPRDVGDVAVARLLSTAWSGRRVQGVHGPEDLTFEQVAEIVSASGGRAVRAVRIGDDELRAGLRAAGMTDAQVEGFVGMASGLCDGFVPEDPRTVLTTTPTTLAAWVHEHLRPALA